MAKLTISSQAHHYFIDCPSQGTIEEKAVINMTAQIAVDILVEYTNTSPTKEEEEVSSQPALMLGVVSRSLLFVPNLSFNIE